MPCVENSVTVLYLFYQSFSIVSVLAKLFQNTVLAVPMQVPAMPHVHQIVQHELQGAETEQ